MSHRKNFAKASTKLDRLKERGKTDPKAKKLYRKKEIRINKVLRRENLI